jgi:hypothetical protein
MIIFKTKFTPHIFGSHYVWHGMADESHKAFTDFEKSKGAIVIPIFFLQKENRH